VFQQKPLERYILDHYQIGFLWRAAQILAHRAMGAAARVQRCEEAKLEQTELPI
jgi:hypothetical protein